jgi:hypothetical protein
MHLNYNTTIHLSVEDVEKIIKDFLEKEGFNAISITFDVKREICGYGPGEHECVNFKGVTARS